MLEFIAYLLFMLIGMVIAAFLGYHVMLRLWRNEDKAERDFLGVMIAALIAIFGASR